jgi:hypothetical protein
MSYIAGKLKHRIHIMQGVDTPNERGGFSRSYKKLITLWAGKRSTGNFIYQIRSMNNDSMNSSADTDEFFVRFDAVVSKFNRTFDVDFGESFDSNENNGLSRQFDQSFDNGFDSLIDMYPIKADYFIFLTNGNSDAYRGRRYKINRIIRDDNTKELVVMRCTEIEEVGLGAKE